MRRLLRSSFGIGLLTALSTNVLTLTSPCVASDDDGKPRMLCFHATWCPPCQQLSPEVERVKKQFGEQIEIVDVDVDLKENRKLCRDHSINAIPTVVFIHTSGAVQTLTGLNKKELNYGVRWLLSGKKAHPAERRIAVETTSSPEVKTE